MVNLLDLIWLRSIFSAVENMVNIILQIKLSTEEKRNVYAITAILLIGIADFNTIRGSTYCGLQKAQTFEDLRLWMNTEVCYKD